MGQGAGEGMGEERSARGGARVPAPPHPGKSRTPVVWALHELRGRASAAQESAAAAGLPHLRALARLLAAHLGLREGRLQAARDLLSLAQVPPATTPS